MKQSVNMIGGEIKKYNIKHIIKKHKTKTENIFKKYKIFQKNKQWDIIDQFYNKMKEINHKYNRIDLCVIYMKLNNELINEHIELADQIFNEIINSYEHSCKINANVNDVMDDISTMLGVENK